MSRGYNVELNSVCTYRHQSEEEWGSWGESYSNSFESIEKTSDRHGNFHSELALTTGDKAYVVWAEWSTGDSFGSGDRNYTETLEIFTSYDHARQFKDELEKCTSREECQFQTTLADGREYKLYIPWIGYFESLDEIHIEEAIVK